MKKRMIVASGFALVLALGACGKSSDDNATSNAKSKAKTEPAAETPAAPPATVAVAKSDKGEVLVDANGMTLYRFDKDTSGASNCAGQCAQTWPPLLLEAGAAAPVTGEGVQGPLSVIARSDGGRQVADNGRPLYRYAGDTKAGDTNGDGIGTVWHVVTTGTRPPRPPRPPRPAPLRPTPRRPTRLCRRAVATDPSATPRKAPVNGDGRLPAFRGPAGGRPRG